MDRLWPGDRKRRGRSPGGGTRSQAGKQHDSQVDEITVLVEEALHMVVDEGGGAGMRSLFPKDECEVICEVLRRSHSIPDLERVLLIQAAFLAVAEARDSVRYVSEGTESRARLGQSFDGGNHV
jgi:hypothetical protein